MEAVGAGASIATFLAIAFSVAKSIHETLSVIKDGPRVVFYLKEEISQLGSILQRLSRVSFISVDITDMSELEDMVKKCQENLVDIASKLQSLDASITDGKRERLWRKVKLCFTEKDLDQIWHVVRGYVQLLTVRLSLFQIQQGAFTATQSTETFSLLQQLRQDVTALQISTNHVQALKIDSASTQPRFSAHKAISPADDAFHESITRLMKLLEKKPCVVESDRSQELVKDLECLLHSLQNNVPLWSSTDSCGHEPDVTKELKLIASLTLSAPSININMNGPVEFFPGARPESRVSQEKKRRTIDGDDGTVTITTTKRHRRPISLLESSQDNGALGREFLAKITYSSKRKRKMLTLSVNQRQLLFDSFTSMLPSITVCNIIPTYSTVIGIAKEGSVEDLLKLIAQGEANLHDHDTNGWSLLHHSVDNIQMLKFLIEQGLDVNEIAGSPELPSSQTYPLSIACEDYIPLSNYEILLLAGADPTISVEGQISGIQSLASAVSDEVLMKRNRAFNISPFVYADSVTEENQDLIARVCAHNYVFKSPSPQSQRMRQGVEVLLKNGYNINSTWMELTGLHVFFQRYAYHSNDQLEQRNFLVFMVQQGADVYAIDRYGHSVSQYAYNDTCEACYLLTPSLKGDLWDAALDHCGYDILQFRKSHPRQARYTSWYTRQDFENLWHGRENRCPYWDDQTWPSYAQEDWKRDRWPLVREKLCMACVDCLSSLRYCGPGSVCGARCGACLSMFRFLCRRDDHRHGYGCPTIQVAQWKEKKRREWVLHKLEEPVQSNDGYGISMGDFNDDQTSFRQCLEDDHVERVHELSETCAEISMHESSLNQPASMGPWEFDDSWENSTVAVEYDGFNQHVFEQQVELYANPWQESNEVFMNPS